MFIGVWVGACKGLLYIKPGMKKVLLPSEEIYTSTKLFFFWRGIIAQIKFSTFLTFDKNPSSSSLKGKVIVLKDRKMKCLEMENGI